MDAGVMFGPSRDRANRRLIAGDRATQYLGVRCQDMVVQVSRSRKPMRAERVGACRAWFQQCRAGLSHRVGQVALVRGKTVDPQQVSAAVEGFSTD